MLVVCNYAVISRPVRVGTTRLVMFVTSMLCLMAHGFIIEDVWKYVLGNPCKDRGVAP